jgi:hypothetical protein
MLPYTSSMEPTCISATDQINMKTKISAVGISFLLLEFLLESHHHHCRSHQLLLPATKIYSTQIVCSPLDHLDRVCLEIYTKSAK